MSSLGRPMETFCRRHTADATVVDYVNIKIVRVIVADYALLHPGDALEKKNGKRHSDIAHRGVVSTPLRHFYVVLIG